MRCKNCGWDNTPGIGKCIKCNAPLNGSMIDPSIDQPSKVDYSPSSGEFNPSKTVWEEDVFEKIDVSEQNTTCRECGYTLRSNDTSCPHCNCAVDKGKSPVTPGGKKNVPHSKSCLKCHTSVAPGAQFCSTCGSPLNKKGFAGTVNPWEMIESLPSCSLSMLPREGEQLAESSKVYTGEEIELNRENTEPYNQTITSKVQALLSYENNRWFIQDKSRLQTTYIHVGEKRELKDGDVIILGNRPFKFSDQ